MLLITVSVIVCIGEFGDAPKDDTLYLALFSNILHRMRFSKFVTIASQKLGQDKNVSSFTQNEKICFIEKFPD